MGGGGRKVNRVGSDLDGASRGPETKFQKQTCGLGVWGKKNEGRNGKEGDGTVFSSF